MTKILQGRTKSSFVAEALVRNNHGSWYMVHGTWFMVTVLCRSSKVCQYLYISTSYKLQVLHHG